MEYLLSTMGPNVRATALQYGLGLEIAEYCTAWNMDDKFSETDPTVRATIKDLPCPVLHGPFNELFPCAIDPLARELAKKRYRQTISLAQSYGAKKVVIHGGYNPKIYFPVWYTEQSVVFWQSFVQEVPEDITIVLENVMEEEIPMFLDILQKVNDKRLRMCLDVGHVNAYSPTSALQWLQTCAPYISHFHIHNNFGDWDTHNALWDGSIPMEEFLHEANTLCPNTTCTLELMQAEPSVQWLLEKHFLTEKG